MLGRRRPAAVATWRPPVADDEWMRASIDARNLLPTRSWCVESRRFDQQEGERHSLAIVSSSCCSKHRHETIATGLILLCLIPDDALFFTAQPADIDACQNQQQQHPPARSWQICTTTTTTAAAASRTLALGLMPMPMPRLVRAAETTCQPSRVQPQPQPSHVPDGLFYQPRRQ